MKISHTFLTLVLVSFALTFTGTIHASEKGTMSKSGGGTSMTGGDFTLLNAKGETVDQNILKDRLTLIYFGYTSCLFQCPPTWITLDAVMAELGPKIKDLQVLFVSIDPARDTVANIAEWQKTWPNLTILTGSAEQVQNVSHNAFHIFYAKTPMHAMPFTKKEMMLTFKKYGDDKRVKWDVKKPENFYMMDHTTQIFLKGRDGKYITHFEKEEPAQTYIDIINKL
jgi:cytochrome oxidase Cu insertion factor (SCO1/SenC/PrrC family)